MGSSQPPARASLCNLPDELLLEMLSYFAILQSRSTQTQAFRSKAKERARQESNHYRRLALASICLTNRRLNTIATPLLYSAFAFCASLTQMPVLDSFLHTIIARQDLAQCVRYIESRLWDWRGNSLFEDLDHLPVAGDPVVSTQRLWTMLASIIVEARNVSNLNVISIGTDSVTLWPFIQNTPIRLCKLQSVAVQAHYQHGYPTQYSFDEMSLHQDARALFGALNAFDSSFLTDLRISDVGFLGDMELESDLLSRLQRFELSRCFLSVSEVVGMLCRCRGQKLKHFTCTFRNGERNVPHGRYEIFKALIQYAPDLETLSLDQRFVDGTREPSDEDVNNNNDDPVYHSEQPCLAKLRSMTVDLLSFWEAKNRGLFLERLEDLALHCTLISEEPSYFRNLVRGQLEGYIISKDYDKKKLPQLRRVYIASSRGTVLYLTSTGLPQRFANLGIELWTGNEYQLLAILEENEHDSFV